MPKRTELQRIERVLEFIVGLGHPEVRAALNGRGFTHSELEEGFRLMREAIEAFHAGDAQPPAPRDTSTASASDVCRHSPTP